MTIKRINELERGDAKLTNEEIAAGYHFCPDWDGMVIGPGQPEMEGCLCSDHQKGKQI